MMPSRSGISSSDEGTDGRRAGRGERRREEGHQRISKHIRCSPKHLPSPNRSELYKTCRSNSAPLRTACVPMLRFMMRLGIKRCTFSMPAASSAPMKYFAGAPCDSARRRACDTMAAQWSRCPCDTNTCCTCKTCCRCCWVVHNAHNRERVGSRRSDGLLQSMYRGDFGSL